MNKIILSYTRISTFLSCRLKYKYIYIDKLVPKKPKSQPLQVGDIVHRLIHKWKTKGLTLDDFQNADKLVDTIYPDNPQDVSLDVALEAATLVGGYIQSLPPLHHVSSEIHLELPCDGYSLYARADGLVRTDDGRLWRHEIKTSSRMDSAYLSGLRKGLQSSITHYILDNLLKEKCHGSIFDILIKSKQPRYERSAVPKSNASIKRALDTINGVIRDIKRNDYYPSSKCYSYNQECEYLLLCEQGPIAIGPFYTQKEEEENEDYRTK